MAYWLRVGTGYVLSPDDPADPLVWVRLGSDGRWFVVIEDDGATFELPQRWALLHRAQEAAQQWLSEHGKRDGRD